MLCCYKTAWKKETLGGRPGVEETLILINLRERGYEGVISIVPVKNTVQQQTCLLGVPTFYGTRRLITAFTKASHWSLFLAIFIQPITPHSISLRSILIISSHLSRSS
jgi:hypothetical protein